MCNAKLDFHWEQCSSTKNKKSSEFMAHLPNYNYLLEKVFLYSI